MCKVLGVPRSTFYKSKNHTPSKREEENEKLLNEIQTLHTESEQRYGAPKIHKQLLKTQFNVSLKRVQRLMKQHSLRSIIVKKFRPHSTKKTPTQKPNLINDLVINNRNQVWVGDITYIHTKKHGWCYLASVMDVYTKKIIGWCFSKRMTTDCVVQALNNAIGRQGLSEGLIFHSDMGSQYTSQEFEQLLQSNEIKHSFSKKGYPYDNAAMESFHATLKKEEVYVKNYDTYEEARLALFKYIESWYNRKRIHGSINDMTPEAFDLLLQSAS